MSSLDPPDSIIDITSSSDYTILDDKAKYQIEGAFSNCFHTIVNEIIRNNPGKSPAFYLNEAILILKGMANRLHSS